MPKPFTVRLLALDGVWEVPGIDRERGVWAEDLTTEGDRWGGSKATFTLKRDARFVWPDLRAFNQVEIETDTLCFSGRIDGSIAHSGDDRQINVQVEGLQFHLDDDQYERIYLHNRLADYRDWRSFLTAPLGGGALIQAANVTADKGITIGFPKSTVLTAFDKVGVLLDLGPASTGKRVVITWTSSNNDASSQFIVTGVDAPDLTGRSDVITVAMNGGASGTNAATFATAKRYIGILMQDTGAGHTPAADVWLQITAIQVFADATYESGNASNLKAPVVLKDAVASATVLLSADQSQIDPANTVTLNIPALAPSEPQTPREMMNGANAYHDYKLQVDVLKRLVFLPKPSAPIFEVGDWAPLARTNPTTAPAARSTTG
jgi:hypothetical protein